MDRMFEHIERMFDDMMFSGFFNREFFFLDKEYSPRVLEKNKHQSPRDEMLRHPEDDNSSKLELPVPEPWTPFPFYGDLVKPDMMNRDIFNEAQRQQKEQDSPKQDIILDDSAPLPGFQHFRSPNTNSSFWWSRSFSRKEFRLNDNFTESEQTVVREPDGSEIHTTIERSPQGERKHIIYKKPSGEVVDATNADHNIIIHPDGSPMRPPSITDQPSTSSSEPTGLWSSLKRWLGGQ